MMRGAVTVLVALLSGCTVQRFDEPRESCLTTHVECVQDGQGGCFYVHVCDDDERRRR